MVKSKNSLEVKNCKNLKLVIKNKINKLSLYNCSNIEIIMSDAIIGVEFYKCKDIDLKVLKKIYSFESFKSNVKLHLDKKIKKNIYFNNENSVIL